MRVEFEIDANEEDGGIVVCLMDVKTKVGSHFLLTPMDALHLTEEVSHMIITKGMDVLNEKKNVKEEV